MKIFKQFEKAKLWLLRNKQTYRHNEGCTLSKTDRSANTHKDEGAVKGLVRQLGEDKNMYLGLQTDGQTENKQYEPKG